MRPLSQLHQLTKLTSFFVFLTFPASIYPPPSSYFPSISDIFVNFLLYLWAYGWMKVILTLIDDSLFICVSSSSFDAWNTNFSLLFFCYIKSHRFFLFFSTLFWMDGWGMDGTDGRSYLVGVCAFFFFLDTFVFVPTSTTPPPLCRRRCKEREAGEYFFHLLNLKFYHFFVLYSPKTFPPFFHPPHGCIPMPICLSIYLSMISI